MSIRTVSGSMPSAAGGFGAVTGTALMIAGVVGTGVLILPGLAVRDAGPAALVAVTALLLVSVPLATTFAALGSRYPGAGGVSHFVATAFGQAPATITAWWFYLGVPLGVPAMGLFAGDYLEAAVGGGTATRSLTAMIVLLVAFGVNLRGIKMSGSVQVVLTAVLMVSLIAVLIVSLPAAQFDRLTPFTPHGWSAIAPAALVLVWMLTGWEVVTHLTGRFRNARRDVPRATAATLIVVAVLFGGVTLALLTALDTSTASDSAPVTALLTNAVGPAAAAVSAGVALLVTVGNTNTYVAGLAELGAEMGRVTQAPRWLSGPTTSTVPSRSLMMVTGQALFSLGVVTVFDWPTEHLIQLTAASQVAVFGAGMLAALRLLPRWSRGWWAAAVALPPILLLAVLSSWYLLAPIGLAAAATCYRHATALAATHIARHLRASWMTASSSQTWHRTQGLDGSSENLGPSAT